MTLKREDSGPAFAKTSSRQAEDRCPAFVLQRRDYGAAGRSYVSDDLYHH